MCAQALVCFLIYLPIYFFILSQSHPLSLVRLTGQQAPRIFLSLPVLSEKAQICVAVPSFYLCAGNLSSDPNVVQQL